jgi:hypothetical protein
MIARTTVVICLLAAVAETVLGCTSTAGLSRDDAAVILFVVGPYLLLGWLAWRQRGRRVVSWALLAVAAALSAWGVAVFAVDSYRYHTEPQYRLVQRVAVFFVPLLQWAVVALAGLALLAGRSSTRRQNTAP